MDQPHVVFIDAEISCDDSRLLELGALREDGDTFRSSRAAPFVEFVRDAHFICGHNIVDFDVPMLEKFGIHFHKPLIDTLYLSALLFPKKPYHRLVKDDKIVSEQLNDPVADAGKAKIVFDESAAEFCKLPRPLQRIYGLLLRKHRAFEGFFAYLRAAGLCLDDEAIVESKQTAALILDFFEGKLCSHADVLGLIAEASVELAYSLALISADDGSSTTPAWLMHRFPSIETVMQRLRSTCCQMGCKYCSSALNLHVGLRRFFGFDQFRLYAGEPLQELAAQAAINGESLLAIFPTGGGKSLAFQLPALMAAQASRGLTVVISPLQSLMKDQVDHLMQAGISEAATINGMLDPVERAKAYELVINVTASIVYLSPEALRSKTIEKVLLSRRIERFVIDEAHCFSAWGHDFRVDYLFIADFIARVQRIRGSNRRIPVSCFTATARQRVVQDICEYFREKLGLELKIFASKSVRTNLRYKVTEVKDAEEKYARLREILEQKNCPCIVYVSSVRLTLELANRLSTDGFPALAYNGPMPAPQKKRNQEDFLSDRVRIIVATNAFGMGVDKKDIGLIVHYDISPSLENYVQEAGRGARDPNLQADCWVLFCEGDLQKHFQLLSQSRLSLKEIKDIWRGIKELAGPRQAFSSSALELARAAGWSDEQTNNASELETKVKTALAALEDAQYIRREMNSPRVYATSIQVKNQQEAVQKISSVQAFADPGKRQKAERIMRSLISRRSTSMAVSGEAESRIDYLSDRLGIAKPEVIEIVTDLREAGILKDDTDMGAVVGSKGSQKHTMRLLKDFFLLEKFLADELRDRKDPRVSLKELNTKALENALASSVKNIRTIFYFWRISGLIDQLINAGSQCVDIRFEGKYEAVVKSLESRKALCSSIIEILYSLPPAENYSDGKSLVKFSLVGLSRQCKSFSLLNQDATTASVRNALLYLSKIEAFALEGGFLVIYNAMTIRRLVADNRMQYRKDDYKKLDGYYRQKIQQVHIVAKYASLLAADYGQALAFVKDYFSLDYKLFIRRYFKDESEAALSRPITQSTARRLFDGLSEIQRKIVNDKQSQFIAVAAGPGSGKTKVLVHKLASLLLLEETKSEQLLVLTFSRAAATVFKQRLIELIGS